jgi:hypothetical protein
MHKTFFTTSNFNHLKLSICFFYLLIKNQNLTHQTQLATGQVLYLNHFGLTKVFPIIFDVIPPAHRQTKRLDIDKEEIDAV